MNRELKKTILQSIGLSKDDKYNVRFFKHKVFDSENKSIQDAIKLANEQAQQKTEIMGQYQSPDYSPRNLKKLGAKQEYKELLYVEIKRVGAKDYRSMLATEQHKQQFSDEYNKFLAGERHEKDVQKKRENLQINTNGQQDMAACTSTGFGEFNYTFNY